MAYTDNKEKIYQGFSVETDEKWIQGKLALDRFFWDKPQLKLGGEYLYSIFHL